MIAISCSVSTYFSNLSSSAVDVLDVLVSNWMAGLVAIWLKRWIGAFNAIARVFLNDDISGHVFRMLKRNNALELPSHQKQLEIVLSLCSSPCNAFLIRRWIHGSLLSDSTEVPWFTLCTWVGWSPQDPNEGVLDKGEGELLDQTWLTFWKLSLFGNVPYCCSRSPLL